MKVVLSDAIVDIEVRVAKHIPVFKYILDDIPDADMLPLQSISERTMDNILYYVEYDMEEPITSDDIKYIGNSVSWINEYFNYLSFNEIIDVILAADVLNYKNLYGTSVIFLAKYLDEFCKHTQIFGYVDRYIDKHRYTYYEYHDDDVEGIEYDEEERFYESNRSYDF